MKIPRPSLPTAIRWVNAAGSVAARAGLDRDALDPDALCARATREAGLSDFGDPHFRPALEQLLESGERDARLHFLGRRHLHELVLRALVTRLRLVARAPEAARIPLRPPLLVCGLPRSGTTFLHRLLAHATDARGIPLWQLMDPLPGPGPDRRIAEAEARLARLKSLVPTSIDAQHLMRADLPDECGHLFKPTFLSSLYWLVPATGYLDWYPRQDFRPAYREYRDLLALLADPSKRLVLKDPFHAMNLPALFAAVPDAMVVQTHRAPSEILPSFHKLALTMHAVLSDGVDVGRVVAADTAWLEHVARRSVEDRASVPAKQVLDVDYRALVADPVAVVRDVHARFHLGWSDGLEARLQRFVADNGQRKHGDNPYDAGAFGQTTDEIDGRFSAYRQRFL